MLHNNNSKLQTATAPEPSEWPIDSDYARKSLHKSYFSMVVVGARQTGKSTFVTNLANFCGAQIVAARDGDDVLLQQTRQQQNDFYFLVQDELRLKEPVINDKASVDGALRIVVAQWWCDIPPRARRNFDYVVLVGRQDKRTLARIWEQYEHLFDSTTMSLETFSQHVSAITNKPWTQVVIDVSLPVWQGLRFASIHYFKSCE